MNIDYGAAGDFLAAFFGPTTEHNVEIRSLPQEHGGGPNRPRFTRDAEIVEEHLVKWDQPGRACYFGACTRVTGKASGSRADCAELPALWVDIDCEKIKVGKTEAVFAALALPMRPSILIDSGGGIHCYWLLNEALDVRVERELGPHLTTPDDDAIVAVLRQLCGVLAGDVTVCDLARVMRLPGTFNHKYSEARLCSLLDVSDFSIRYEFSDLVDMLDRQRPLLRRSIGESPSLAPELMEPENDPFLEMARLTMRKPPVDVATRLSKMSYLAEGDAGVHATQLSVTASLAATGVDQDEIVATVLKATEIAAGLDGASWNWKREEKAIREMAQSAAFKFKPKAEIVTRPPLRLVGGSGAVVSAAAPSMGSGQAEEKNEEEAVKEGAPPSEDPKIKSKIAEVVRRFNSTYFVVNEEGHVLVYEPAVDETIGRRCYRRLTFDDLRRLWLNHSMVVGKDKKGEDKFRTLAEIWLTHHDRKTFNRIVFDPRSTSLPSSTLNLWQGFAVAPIAGSWELMRSHILSVICRDNVEHFDFLVGWMARLVQHPELQGEVAVVLKGPEGAGKGTLARALMKILGQHSMAVSSAKHLIGSFNGHLRDLVFLFADEAFWAGDKQHVGVLKSLITEPFLTIEAKYQAPVQMRNYIHLMMASNEDWVVPASIGSRRFFVLETAELHLNDIPYFAAIDKEMESGGYGAMLEYLLSYDLSDYSLRSIPASEGLNDQRIMSLPTADEWWMTVLQRGYVWQSRLGLESDFCDWWPIVSTQLLHASYLEFARGRERRPLNPVHFGRFMRRMGNTPTRPSTGVIMGEHVTDNSMGGRTAKSRVDYNQHCYALGDLEFARDSFSNVTGLTIEWEGGV